MGRNGSVVPVMVDMKHKIDFEFYSTPSPPPPVYTLFNEVPESTSIDFGSSSTTTQLTSDSESSIMRNIQHRSSTSSLFTFAPTSTTTSTVTTTTDSQLSGSRTMGTASSYTPIDVNSPPKRKSS